MAIKMTKCGDRDNEITYEHICDTVADLDKIEKKYATLGSVAIVIKGESGLEVYIADGQRQWVNLGSAGEPSNNASGPSSNVVGQGTSGHMIVHDNDDSAADT